jgi:hypothetical protein
LIFEEVLHVVGPLGLRGSSLQKADVGAELPRCSGERVWRFAADKIKPNASSALIVVDVQNCFLPGGSLAVKEGIRLFR